MADGSDIKAFRVSVPDADLRDLRDRLARTRWPDQIPDSGWRYGTDIAYLREIVGYWRDHFDWRAQEARLNAIEQGVTLAAGERLHFLHARSPEPAALPLVITHGWPGSVVEFLDVIGPLSDPRSHGGDPADAFHVVCPSMPGYAFSGPTRTPGCDFHRVADAVAELMAKLGYGRFVAQGGDWGALVTRRLGEAHADRLLGAHFNMLFALPDPTDPEPMRGVSEAELARFGAAAAAVADGTAYMEIQGTRPQTLAYGLTDSPAGLAGWILEKFRAWSDCGGDLESVYSKDQLLANLAVYWFTGTANSAARLYYESRQAGRAASAHWDGRVEVPTGYTRYPGELLQTPRAWAEKHYTNIVHWTEQPRGGHFAAFEQPALFVEDLRAFGRRLRA